MADTGNVLSATLQVKDSFTSQLNKFANRINDTENAFTKFCSKIDQSGTKIEQTLDKINKKMEQTTNKITGQTDKITSSIEKSTNKIEQSQQKSMDNLVKKYTQMGGSVQNVFKNINKDAESLANSGLKINIGNNSSNKMNSGSSNLLGGVLGSSKTESFLTGFLGGNFTRMFGALGIIGGALTGATKILSTLDGWAEQGFNAINTLSTGLLSIDGLKQGVEDAGQFEQNRISMDMLYGGDKTLGHEYYKMGVSSAKATTYGEKETGELQKKLAGAHISYDAGQLNLLADIASLKPEQPLSKVGFSIVDAMYGRTTSLKSQYMLDNKEVQAYLKTLKKTDPTDAKKWKDAFNTKGAVNNKQEYFDLLMNYVEKDTHYKGLNAELMKTMLGKADRLQGNWETLKADLLGIDANDTGMVKSGKITVISSIEDALDNLDTWLAKSDTKTLLDDVGSGLGIAIHSVTEAFSYALEHVNWKLVGDTFEKIGKQVQDFIEKITADGTLEKLLKALPVLTEKVMKNEVIKTKTSIETGANIATGNYGGALVSAGHGIDDRIANDFGFSDSMDKAHSFTDSFGNLWDKFRASNGEMLTDANASDILAQNPNLTNDDRNKIEGMINNDNTSTYNITVGEIKTDNVEGIIASLEKYQTNKK